MVVEAKDDDENRKVPRSEWSGIVSRFARGESLASIGRSYGCSAPAVRYIVRKQAPETYAAVRERRRLRPKPGADRGAALVIAPLLGRQRTARPTSQGAAGMPTQADDAMRETPASEHEGFDQELQQQVKIDLSAFLVAFDAVVAGGIRENFQRLRECTDKLLHTAAWTRIELERVEMQRRSRRARTPESEQPSRKARG
jgi:hypothetical protein